MPVAEVILPALAGLFGAIAGAAATALAARWTLASQVRLEDERWHREDATRFISEKRQLYAQFVAAIDDVVDRLGQLPLVADVNEGSEVDLLSTRLEQLAEAYRRVRRLGEEIELVGSEPVVEAWVRILDQLRNLDPATLRRTIDNRKAFHNEFGRRVGQFVNAARIELRVGLLPARLAANSLALQSSELGHRTAKLGGAKKI